MPEQPQRQEQRQSQERLHLLGIRRGSLSRHDPKHSFAS
jgi:hypothetical protein